MANDAQAFYTALDVAKATAENGVIEPVLDIVLRRNGLFEKMLWTTANRPETHRVQQISGVDASTKIGYDQGVAHTKTTRRWITEELALFSARSTADKRMKLGFGQTIEQFIEDEDRAKLAQITTDFMEELVYGATADDPYGFNGLYQRMATLTMATELAVPTNAYDSPVISAGGSASGTMSSVLLVQLGQDKTFCVHGQGAKSMGVDIMDMGLVRLTDANGRPYPGIEHYITLNAGLVVRNPRSIGRVANINLATADIINANAILRKIYLVQGQMVGGGTTYALCSPALYAFLKDYAFTRQNINVTVNEFGHEFSTFGGVSWIPMDVMLNTDATVA